MRKNRTKIFVIGMLVFLLLQGSVLLTSAEVNFFDVVVVGENDGDCEGEYWVEDTASPYKWVKNPAWTEPTCDYEKVQHALDMYPGGKILLSGVFDFNDRNVAIMYDNTEIHGDGTAVIKNGANAITVGHLRHDIQYHFADPDQFDYYKVVHNFVINNIRFEESLWTAVAVVGHDGNSTITNNEFVGGRFTAENVGYPNHNINIFILVYNLLYGDTAIKGVIDVDNNYFDGQFRLDPNGHKFWYFDRPDLKYNGMVWGIVNFVNRAIVNVNNNTIKNVGNGFLFWTFPTNVSGLVSITNNTIETVNAPYTYNNGITIVTWAFTNFEYLISDNEITVDYQPSLDFANYPEWGSDPSAEYLRAIVYDGIVMDTFEDVEAVITKNTIRFTDSHPEQFFDYSGIFFLYEESNLPITNNKFEGSAQYGINFLGGNSGNILHANNFEKFTPIAANPFLEPADIIFGSGYPVDNNVVLAGGSSSGKLDIIDNGTGNIVGNNNVAHSDPHQMQSYMDVLRGLDDLVW